MPQPSLHEILDTALERAVAITTGRDDAQPRPGQVALAHDALTAMLVAGQAAGAAPTGVGKALDLRTPIATPSGWTTMGEIKVGDVVFDETGAETTVTWISNVMTDRACYEVAFSDGSSIIADADHQWATVTRSLRFKQAERRRMESGKGKNSLGRLQHLDELRALRTRVEQSGSSMTRREVSDRFPDFQDALLRARSRLNSRNLGKSEAFDIRPALDEVISRTQKISALSQDPPDEFEVMTTAQMSSTLVCGDALNHAVRVAGPLDTKMADLPIDPYLLGVWLGDGSSGAGNVTSGTEDFDELMKNVQSAGYHINVSERKNHSFKLAFLQPRPDLCPYGHDDFVPNMGERVNRTCVTCVKTRPSKDNRSRENRWNEPLTLHLRQLGVLCSKHIPSSYLRASIEQRHALLQGIMDTDGTASGRKCGIDLCNERLAIDVFELIVSLGIRATIRTAPATISELVDGVRRTRVVGTRWRMSFTTNTPMFRFERKLAMQMRGKPSPGTNARFRYVTGIRPVETRPVRCIQVSSPNHLFLAGKTMIPTHNSIAYSIPAALLAAKRLERTVIATESLNLQSQLVEKDLPVVVEAIERVTGTRPRFALLKGWSNYVCAASAYQAACDIAGIEARPPSSPLKGLIDAKDALNNTAFFTNEVEVVKWALEENIEPRSGDRAGLTIDATDEMWNSVSTTSAECPGALQCPFGDVCRPGIARETAGEADIIVTNHAMLAIQAANTVKVVIGNKTVGPIHHLVVDEAHGLANTVRSQGATVVNAARLFDVLRSVEHLYSGSPGKTKDLRTSGLGVMAELDAHLAKTLRGKTSFTIAPKDECLGEGLSGLVVAWLDAARRLVPRPDSSVVMGEIRARYRAISKIDVLKNAVGSIATDAMNVARWVETDNRFNRAPIKGLESLTGATLRLSPVDVGPMLRSNLYEAQLGTYASTDDGDVEMGQSEEALPMSVVVLSATLPQSSVVDLGIVARRVEYPSPFTVAFANSALFVPKASSEDLAELCFMENGKYRFNTSAHAEWASRYINQLVAANGGSALVLSSTTNAGKRYAEALRMAHPDLVVHSQWDGPTKCVVAEWRQDIGSVLVGTRSLMTGVDAPGTTCDLVIIDRVPRSAGNPVDDARTAKVQERLSIDRWSADRLTYASDASLLMTQAAGRLIRAVTDSGLVAILDPRLLKSAVSGLRYPEPTRQIYMSAFESFATKISDPKKAIEWIAAHKARTSPLDARR